MNGKYFLVNNRGDRKVIKDICKVFPYNCISIFCLTLHVKPIILGDGTGLVVSSDHVHLRGVFDFVET